MLRAIIPSQLTELGEDEVEIRMMTGALARDGHVIDPTGVVLDNYLRNPMQLWQHNPEFPVGRNEDIRLDGDSIVARSVFAPSGISAKADEVRGLVKSGIVGAVSIGFDVLEAEPLNPGKPRGGLHITRWELLECSYVSVPADPGAVVTARDFPLSDENVAVLEKWIAERAMKRADEADDWKVGASRDLPIEDSDAWDGPAAQESIFEYAGGDDFDSDKAKKGFLVYNAAKPTLKGSYKLPFAHVVDGEMKVPKGAIRAAASRLPQTDIPDEVKKTAEDVLDHYKKKAGIGTEDGNSAGSDETPRASVPKKTRHQVEKALKARGMYAVSQLAWLVDCLADQVSMAEYEAAIEEDGSTMAEQLQTQLHGLGACLIAMTQEEVAELIGGEDVDPMGSMMMFSASPGLTRRMSGTGLRAGKAMSQANMDKLTEADGHHNRALEHHGDAEEARSSMGERCDGMRDAHEKAMDAHEKMGEALDAGDLDEAKKHHARMKRNMDAIADHNTGLGDDNEAMADAHRGIARCVRAAQRCVRAVAEPGISNDDNAAENDPMAGQHAAPIDWKRRQAEKQALRGT